LALLTRPVTGVYLTDSGGFEPREVCLEIPVALALPSERPSESIDSAVPLLRRLDRLGLDDEPCDDDLETRFDFRRVTWG